jgi:hypothetical protein
MQQALKFLHTLGAMGFTGSILALIVMASQLPDTASLAQYVDARSAMSSLAKVVFVPSMLVVLLAGMLSMAINRSFHSAGWALVKLATGILLFEGGLVSVQGPMQREAERGAAVLMGNADAASLGAGLGSERLALWVLLAVATANIALAIWRPRRLWSFRRRTTDTPSD